MFQAYALGWNGRSHVARILGRARGFPCASVIRSRHGKRAQAQAVLTCAIQNRRRRPACAREAKRVWAVPMCMRTGCGEARAVPACASENWTGIAFPAYAREKERVCPNVRVLVSPYLKAYRDHICLYENEKDIYWKLIKFPKKFYPLYKYIFKNSQQKHGMKLAWMHSTLV
jgi:hypothetical protein